MVYENKRVEEMNYFELIAWLGIGSSHPGGFPATKLNLDAIQVTPEEYVLDAGCGSGLTACHLAKTVGCKIAGVDISPQMIEKARLRAEKEGVSHLVEFSVSDVYDLPFNDNHFDLIIAESITVFLDKVKVYLEFYRVLKPEGRVADLEMALLKELPANLRHQMEQCFGSGTNPLSFEEWHNALEQAGFQDVEIKNPQVLKDNGNVVMNELKKDWLLIKDLTTKIKRQPNLLPRLQKNAGFMKKNRSYFGFGLIYGRKPTPKKLGFKDWVRQVLFRRKA
ncbi:class I SAM-dependent methyltransferase [Desulfosporosinus nitroreducens]|uniref:Methyltransferase domain-containing protein n=1 Tax=Desulfosporosinus nitroreducens TaxID=2018668 RepID=A0ABT8QR01_9FIRM|nr:methyltransferase domain-containing protein [Desulfosporosinus nitroreducens]MDO0823778.1 methyltransferase domain-containing protein [Desulfosporosinus nitroreducens]